MDNNIKNKIEIEKLQKQKLIEREEYELTEANLNIHYYELRLNENGNDKRQGIATSDVKMVELESEIKSCRMHKTQIEENIRKLKEDIKKLDRMLCKIQ